MPFFLLATVLFCTGFGPPRLLDRDLAPTTAISTNQLRVLSESRQIPELTSQATLLYDVDANQILLAQNEHAIRPVASLTKLMTALLVLEAAAHDTGLFGMEVTVRDADLVGGATMGLLGGERRTVEDLLYGLLIPSGNDAATALARYLGDRLAEQVSLSTSNLSGVDAFIERMNQRSVEMGMTQTNFVNPHGIDADGHISTAVDMLVLTRALLQHELFRQIVRLEEVTIGGRPLKNTNQLLSTFPGADGIKTGTTPLSGESLVASITRNNHQVIIIVLGSRNRYEDAENLYAYYEQQYRWSDSLANSGTSGSEAFFLGRIEDSQGNRWYIGIEGEIPGQLLPANNAPAVTNFLRIQRPPPNQIWYRGMRIGLLEWRIGHQAIGTQTLILR